MNSTQLRESGRTLWQQAHEPSSLFAIIVVVVIVIAAKVVSGIVGRRRQLYTDEQFYAEAAMGDGVKTAETGKKSPLDSLFHACSTRLVLLGTALLYWVAVVGLPLYNVRWSVVCDNGLPWECHLLFSVVLLISTTVDVLMTYAVARRPWFWRPTLFIKRVCATGIASNTPYFITLGMITKLDTYSDVCFILVARGCDSMWWKWSLAVLVLGIGCSQFVPNMYAAWRVLNKRVDAHHDDYHTMAHPTAMKLLDHQLSSAALYYVAPDRSQRWVLQAPALFRFIVEEIPQCYIQWNFMQELGRYNPTVLFSLVVSVLCSVLGAMLSIVMILKTAHYHGDNAIARAFTAMHCHVRRNADGTRKSHVPHPETWCGVQIRCCFCCRYCCSCMHEFDDEDERDVAAHEAAKPHADIHLRARGRGDNSSRLGGSLSVLAAADVVGIARPQIVKKVLV